MHSKDWDRISKNYYKEIISPIKNSTGKNPLLKDIDSLNISNNKTIDLGCGIGPLLPKISKKYSEVHAIDFSKEMIEKAKKKNSELKNITYEQADMKNLSKYNNTFDSAYAVNSILAKNNQEINEIIKEIYSVLKKNGKFYGVLPAMESYLYQAMLIIEKETKAGKTQQQAKKIAEELIKKEEHDFLEGSINFEGDKQKTLYHFEIIHRFEKAGFKNINIQKLFYDWKDWKEAGQAFFPKENPPWDWYLTCEK